jgi:hypothetical protein
MTNLFNKIINQKGGNQTIILIFICVVFLSLFFLLLIGGYLYISSSKTKTGTNGTTGTTGNGTTGNGTNGTNGTTGNGTNGTTGNGTNGTNGNGTNGTTGNGTNGTTGNGTNGTNGNGTNGTNGNGTNPPTITTVTTGTTEIKGTTTASSDNECSFINSDNDLLTHNNIINTTFTKACCDSSAPCDCGGNIGYIKCGKAHDGYYYRTTQYDYYLQNYSQLSSSNFNTRNTFYMNVNLSDYTDQTKNIKLRSGISDSNPYTNNLCSCYSGYYLSYPDLTCKKAIECSSTDVICMMKKINGTNALDSKPICSNALLPV